MGSRFEKWGREGVQTTKLAPARFFFFHFYSEKIYITQKGTSFPFTNDCTSREHLRYAFTQISLSRSNLGTLLSISIYFLLSSRDGGGDDCPCSGADNPRTRASLWDQFHRLLLCPLRVPGWIEPPTHPDQPWCVYCWLPRADSLRRVSSLISWFRRWEIYLQDQPAALHGSI